MTTDECYLIGLLVGGGTIINDKLQIVFPYKNWGDLNANPGRAGNIAKDLVCISIPLLRTIYNLEVYYKTGRNWRIISNNISEKLKGDLRKLKLPLEGELRSLADVSTLLKYLDNEEKKRYFIAGLIDTVGSFAKSHRRFTEDFQIVSIEFKGRNFGLVKSIVELCSDLGFVPDQILWNHPNQHSGKNRYYCLWKKGFKVRICLDDYLVSGVFMFGSKKESAEENKKIQNGSNTATNKSLRIEGRTVLHIDQNSLWLPPYIRGLHFIHFYHLCKFFGLILPVKIDIEEALNSYEKYICPFTILSKGSTDEIKYLIENEDYLRNCKFKEKKFDTKKLISLYNKNSNAFIFGNSQNDGFPVNEILSSISYIIAANRNKNIKGKRVLGNFIKNITDNYSSITKYKIKFYVPERGTCLLIKSSRYSSLVGYVNDDFNKKLISREGKYKFRVRSPKFEECVKLK